MQVRLRGPAGAVRKLNRKQLTRPLPAVINRRTGWPAMALAGEKDIQRNTTFDTAKEETRMPRCSG
jgi:hypothetical protein